MTENGDGIQSSERIAIIGMAGRFPAARNVGQFWRMLAGERLGTRWFTDEELLKEGVSRSAIADPNYVPAANFLLDMECFDAGFFGFSPREASILDPQHRHFLECSWEALEDAGHMPENFDGRVGVFAGSGMQAYLPFNLLSNPDLVEEIGLFLLRHTGNDKDFLTTRLSYLLNLQGPSINIQTACSTSLVAMHQAAASLLSMECDMAIAGGVTVELPHRHGYHFSAGEIQSPDGLCRPFDDESQGTVFGSGAAIVILRRLEDALADGDDIRAVLIGSAVNNDGSAKAGYLAPSVDGQAEAAAEALAIAGIAPESVSYIEAHGTGTPVGDPIELAALSQVYGPGGTGFCGIGSVKSNVGHLDTAAGTTSLIKVIEALRHETLPATLHYKTPNSRFDIAASPFYVVDTTRPWPRGAVPRRAAVNSLGVGGTNAHAIIEEAPARPQTQADTNWRIFPFSARTPTALDGLQDKWRRFLGREEAPPALADAAYTLSHGRREFSERRVIIARDKNGLTSGLWQEAAERTARGSAGTTPEITFMFPGGGAQYPGAGAGLLTSSPAFKAAVDDCFNQLPKDAPSDLRVMMFDRALDDVDARARLERSGYAIPALFILEYAYARMWQDWGVQPTAILGHSAGEYAGAVIAGVMSLADALKIVTWRGKVMDAAAAGAMSVIPAPADKVAELIGDSLDIAARNAPDLCVVSGEIAKIEALETELKGTEYEATRVRINVAAHSRILDNQLDNFRNGIAGVTLKAPEIPFVSSLRGDWAEPGDFSTIDYWVKHLRHTVLFADAIETILRKPNQILLEMGPGKTLAPLAEMSAGAHRPLAVLASGRAPKVDEDDMAMALTAAGALWTRGVALDWQRLPGGDTGQRVSLPTYAFARDRHWVEPGKGSPAASNEDDAPAVRLERIANPDNWYQTPTWIPAPIPPAEPGQNRSWMLFHGGDPISEAVLHEIRARRQPCYIVRPGETFAQSGNGFQIAADRTEDYDALLAALPRLPTNIIHGWPLGTEPGADQREIFDSAFCLCRAIQSADPAEDIHLSFVGSGAFSVAGEPVTHPELGTLLGPARVSPREIPSLTTQYLDIDPGASADETAARVLEEHDSNTLKSRVAFRGNARFTWDLARLEASAPDGLPVRLTENGVYVITGGTGGIGLALASYLGTVARARVALIGRRKMPAEAEWAKILKTAPDGAQSQVIRTAQHIKAAGGDVTFLGVDVADAGALSEALATVRAKFGDINGVFHGAGIMDDAPMMMKTLDDTHRVMAAKVTGGQNLAVLLPDGTLDFFAVFSSTSVVTAPPGQVDYVAANGYLEALAASRGDGLAISFGVWCDIGMASRSYDDGAATGVTVHPLLGVASHAKDGTFIFTAQYDPAALWVLNEHIVGGVPVLPGTAYIEIARAAMEQLTHTRSWEIQALSLVNPMVFPEGMRARVVVTLTPDDKGYEFCVESRMSPEAPMVEHCRGQVRLRLFNDRKIPRALNHQLKGLRPSDSSGHDSQEDLIDFGPRWNNIGEIRKGIDEIEADFTLADAFADDLKVFATHPGLMDTAATIGLNLLSDVGREGAFYAPMSIDRLRILKPLPQRFTARAKLMAQTPGRYASFDVVFVDQNDMPLVILEGFALRRVEGASFDWHSSPDLLVDMMIAQGIRAKEAPAVFSRMLNIPAAQIIVSPTPIADLSREMARLAEPRGKKSTGAEISGSLADATLYANPVEQRIAGFWTELLGVDQPAPEADFFYLGGHSLAAVRLFAKIRKEYQIDLPLATLFQAPTLRALSNIVVTKAGLEFKDQGTTMTDTADQEWSPLVAIKEGDLSIKPFYLVHGAGGNVLNFRSLSGYLDPRLPFYALRALGSDGGADIHETIEEMAKCYVAAILKHQPEGPFHIGGYSGGGVVGLEMARQLTEAGHDVDNLVMFDTLAPERNPQKIGLLQKLWTARHWSLGFALKWPQRRWKRRFAASERALIQQYLERGEQLPDELTGQRMTEAYIAAENRYRPETYDGDMLLFKGRDASIEFLRAGLSLGWDDWITGTIRVMTFNCDHFNMMIDPTIGEIGEILNELLVDD
ncbi:SDR family NAD(P)-dependent oxidoreductase [Sneathiella sp.]|uniref:SDR family NAD(P)-dependent oxidoreductase n=1 Tax=Sneathiella sp. TaxID=1964365 RepID=UPI003561DC42